MISDITYQASRAHIDDLHRQAAKQRVPTTARLRPDVSPPQVTKQPRRRLASLRSLVAAHVPAKARL